MPARAFQLRTNAIPGSAVQFPHCTSSSGTSTRRLSSQRKSFPQDGLLGSKSSKGPGTARVVCVRDHPPPSAGAFPGAAFTQRNRHGRRPSRISRKPSSARPSVVLSPIIGVLCGFLFAEFFRQNSVYASGGHFAPDRVRRPMQLPKVMQGIHKTVPVVAAAVRVPAVHHNHRPPGERGREVGGKRISSKKSRIIRRRMEKRREEMDNTRASCDGGEEAAAGDEEPVSEKQEPLVRNARTFGPRFPRVQ